MSLEISPGHAYRFRTRSKYHFGPIFIVINITDKNLYGYDVKTVHCLQFNKTSGQGSNAQYPATMEFEDFRKKVSYREPRYEIYNQEHLKFLRNRVDIDIKNKRILNSMAFYSDELNDITWHHIRYITTIGDNFFNFRYDLLNKLVSSWWFCELVNGDGSDDRSTYHLSFTSIRDYTTVKFFMLSTLNGELKDMDPPKIMKMNNGTRIQYTSYI